VSPQQSTLSKRAALDFVAKCKSGGSDKAFTLPARPNVEILGLAIADKSNSPSKFILPAKPKVEGLGLAITDDNDLPSVARSSVMRNQFFSNNAFIINGVFDSEGRNGDSQISPDTRVKPNSYGASMWQSPISHQNSPWPGVAAGDPRSIGRPPHWRRMNEGRADPWLGIGSRGVATQNLVNIASAAFDRLADRCPACSADLELRDRTLGLTLFTCPFCHTERPRQVDLSLINVPTAWTPPIRVPTTTMLSMDHFTQTRSRSRLHPIPKTHTGNDYTHPSLTVISASLTIHTNRTAVGKHTVKMRNIVKNGKRYVESFVRSGGSCSR